MKEEAMITKNQLHAFSESFRKLSQSFEVDTSPRGTLSDQEMQDIFNAVTEQVCKDCSRCSYCWENVFEDSCESAYEILKLCGERVDMKKKDLCVAAGISHASMAKLGKNENVTTDVLVKICNALQCDIGDIMEMVPETADRKDAE